jgi:hypothetical protein
MIKQFYLLISAALLILSGCAGKHVPTESELLYKEAQTSGTVLPQNELEKKIIAAAVSLKTGQSKKIDGNTITIADEYWSAAGRPCKSITITAKDDILSDKTRLICKAEKKWSFAPDIFLPMPQKKE